jgi:hypothetical protein
MSIALPRAPLPLVPPLPSAPAGIGCIVTLGGVTLPQLPNLYVLAGTMSIVDAINQRTTCTFHVVDVAGVQHFQQGMRLQVTDGSGTILFGGFVANAIESRPGSSSNTMLHAITGMDYHYLADKRIVATSYAAGTTCGAIVQDLITNWLASEGITVGGIQPGPALSGTVTYNYKPASYVLDQVQLVH